MEWGFSPKPRPPLPPGKDPVPISQDAGWAPGPVWTGGKSRPNRDSIPDRPARSQTLYPMPTKYYVMVIYIYIAIAMSPFTYLRYVSQ